MSTIGSIDIPAIRIRVDSPSAERSFHGISCVHLTYITAIGNGNFRKCLRTVSVLMAGGWFCSRVGGATFTIFFTSGLLSFGDYTYFFRLDLRLFDFDLKGTFLSNLKDDFGCFLDFLGTGARGILDDLGGDRLDITRKYRCCIRFDLFDFDDDTYAYDKDDDSDDNGTRFFLSYICRFLRFGGKGLLSFFGGIRGLFEYRSWGSPFVVFLFIVPRCTTDSYHL